MAYGDFIIVGEKINCCPVGKSTREEFIEYASDSNAAKILAFGMKHKCDSTPTIYQKWVDTEAIAKAEMARITRDRKIDEKDFERLKLKLGK